MNNSKLATPELASIEVQGVTREAFIARSALAAGAVYGIGAVGPFLGQALAAGGDIGILQYALTLEYLETAFYTQAVAKTPKLKGTALKVAKTLKEDEQQHVAALTATIKKLGGKPGKAPGVNFKGAFASVASFLATAQTFEDLGVSAYNGAAPLVKSKDILSAAGGIVQVEARHAAVIRYLRGQPITPGAFDVAMDKGSVLAAAKPFIVA